MKDLNVHKPVKEKYNSKTDYYADLIAYFFKANKVILAVLVIVIIAGFIGWLVFDSRSQKMEVEGAKALEKIYDKTELFLTQYQNISNYDKTVEELLAGLDSIENKYRHTTAGKRAIYYKGLIYFIEKNYDESIKEFEKIYKDRNFHAAFEANIGIIRGYLQLNDLDKALKYASKLYSRNKNNILGSYGAYFLGFIYQQKGDVNKSEHYYNLVTTQFDKSSLATDSKYFTLNKLQQEILSGKLEEKKSEE